MKKIILIIAMCLLASGCAKRYDTLTKIESTTETTIKHDGTEAVSQEIPMANGLYRQNLGTGALQSGQVVPAVATVTETRRSLRGKNLVEVTFVKQNGQYSVLEVVESGERFQLKGAWGTAGDRFKIER